MADIIKLPPRSFSGFEIYHTIDNPEFEVKETNKESSDKFVALNGTVDEIAYYDDMLKNSFDEDYEGMSNTGSVSFTTNDINKKRFYKGKKVCLKKANETGNGITWDDLKSCLLGFISEQTFTLDEVELKLVGMSKLLDQEKEFTFNNTLRSEILKQVIEAAGLKAKIDVTGLEDESIDYTNVSSSGSSNSGYSSSSKDIKKLVAGWIGKEKNALRKAELIHNGLRDDVQICWVEYNDSRYETPENCLANHEHLNCGDTSILTVECMREGGLEAYTELRCDSEHYFTVIEIDGTKYYSDLTGPTGVPSTRAFNEVWENNYCGNRHDLP